MTKQNYEKPNMEIVVLEDVIKTSGGCDGVMSSGCTLVDICTDDFTPCTGFSDPCASYSSCLGDGKINNSTIGPIIKP